MDMAVTSKVAIIAVVIVAAVAGAFMLSSGAFAGSTAAVTGNAAAAGAGSDAKTGDAASIVTVPISDIGTDAKFYEHKTTSGKTVRFFALKDSEGTVRVAFDACDVCYSAHKGYRQEAGYMVCNNCGNRYPISGIGTQNRAGGGCWPGYLPSTVSGSSIAVTKADLEAGAWRF